MLEITVLVLVLQIMSIRSIQYLVYIAHANQFILYSYTRTLLNPSVPLSTRLPVTGHRPCPFSHFPSRL